MEFCSNGVYYILCVCMAYGQSILWRRQKLYRYSTQIVGIENYTRSSSMYDKSTRLRLVLRVVLCFTTDCTTCEDQTVLHILFLNFLFVSKHIVTAVEWLDACRVTLFVC